MPIYTNDMSVMVSMYETMIQNERLYRDALLEQYRAMYPGLKYKDPDILQESLELTKNIVCNFFKSYRNNLKSQLGLCVGSLKSTYSEFEALVTNTDINMYTISERYIKLTQYKHTREVPNFDPLIDAINEIKSDYLTFINGTSEEISDLVSEYKEYANTARKKVAKIKPDEYYTIDDVANKCKSDFREDNKKVLECVDDDYFKKLFKKRSNHAEHIKDINGNIDTYMTLITKISKKLDKNIITLKFDIDDIDLSQSDPENLFYRYELTKLSELLNVTTQIIFIKIDAAKEEICQDIDLIKKYLIGNAD